MDNLRRGVSPGENSRPSRPARPPVFTVQPSRPAPPPPTPLQNNTPAYLSVLSEETPAKAGLPARPAPPVPRRPVLSRGERFCQSTDTEESPDIRKGGEIPLYEDVLPNETGCQDGITPLNPTPAPLRPAAPPRPAGVPPRRPFLSQSISEAPAEPLYEFMPDTLLEDEGLNGETSVCAAERKPLPSHLLRSWSECSSVDGDRSAKELDILLEWWNSVDGWEKFLKGHQGQESEAKLLMLVAHRVKTGMRLYQLLVFRRGGLLLNYITELHCTADSLSRVGKNTRIAGITGGTTGAVGAAAVVAGIALAPFTFGASMVAAGIGVGVAAAGGVTGASAAITSKVKSSQVRSKVEKILRNYRFHMEDIKECLEFIDVGMDHLRKRDHSKLKYLDTCALKIVQMAREMDSCCSTDAISNYFCMLQGFASGLDCYFSEEDKLKLKKGSESQFAENIREVADKLKESMDELIRIKNLFRSVVDDV